MHEMGIAQSLLRAAEAEAQRHSGAKLVGIGLRLGELSGVNPEALRFSFEAIIEDTQHRNVTLQIEHSPRRHRCPNCGTTFTVANYVADCPSCGNVETIFEAGDELDVTYIELEDP